MASITKEHTLYNIINFPEPKKNPTDLRVNTWGGGIKTCYPPMSKHGEIHPPPHPPLSGIYTLAEPPSKAYRCDKQIYISEKKLPSHPTDFSHLFIYYSHRKWDFLATLAILTPPPPVKHKTLLISTFNS